MLVLSRDKEESIHIFVGDKKIVIKVLSIRGGRVKLGFDAPLDCTILREEVAVSKNP